MFHFSMIVAKLSISKVQLVKVISYCIIFYYPLVNILKKYSRISQHILHIFKGIYISGRVNPCIWLSKWWMKRKPIWNTENKRWSDSQNFENWGKVGDDLIFILRDEAMGGDAFSSNGLPSFWETKQWMRWSINELDIFFYSFF